MSRAVIGTFFNNRNDAKRYCEKQNKVWIREVFMVVEFKNGFIVVSKRQLENEKN